MKATTLFRILNLIIVCLLTQNLHAQDTIQLRNKSTFAVKVKEIGLDEVKYTMWTDADGIVYSVSKSDIITIRLHDGTLVRIQADPYDVDQSLMNVRGKSHCIKFEFFSPLTNDICLGYEQMLKVGTNIEVKVGAIGPGTQRDADNTTGFFLKAGVKFLSGTSVVKGSTKILHELKGSYIKPELIYSSFSNDAGSYQNGAINLVFGKQTILGNAVTIDYYFGFGYGYQKYPLPTTLPGLFSYDAGYRTYSYSHLFLGKEFPMIISGGLTIGYIF